MTPAPLASIIILTWNGLDFIEACLKAVLGQTYPNFEVIVVDNASTDGTSNFIAQKFPSVQLIQNKKNVGFAAGMNVGMTTANGEFLALLNQDTIVEPTWLAELIKGMSADERVGIGGCKIFDWSGEKLWHTGVTFAKKRKFPALRGAGEKDEGQYDKVEVMKAIVGAAFALRRELLERVGLLDEDYYFYFEDTDYCFRARQAGYKVIYYPNSRLRHYVAASLKKDSYQVLYRFHFSRLLFLLKHYELDWFCKDFKEAEQEYLEVWPSLNEFKALRHAYMAVAVHIAQGLPRRRYTSSPKTFAAKDINRVLQTLAILRDSSLPSLPELDIQKEPFSLDIRGDWSVKPLAFQSNIPIIGPVVAGFRRLWGNIAARWFEQNILQQQNVVNQAIFDTFSMFLWQSQHQFEQQFQQIERLRYQIVAQERVISILEADVAALNEQTIELARQKGEPSHAE